MGIKKNKYGQIVKIDNGNETISEPVNRQKITQKTKEKIAKDIEEGNVETALNSLLEVVSGETKEEILE